MRAKQTQAGFALLILMMILIGIVTVGVSKLLSSAAINKQEKARSENHKRLLHAKEALLAYSLDYLNTSIDQMGQLPCPDVDNISVFAADIEGRSDAACGTTGVNSVGYFPFATLGSAKIEDVSGECLWYAVSGEYKNSPVADMLNWDSVGYLNLKNESNILQHRAGEENFPIAFIISPGASMGQVRGVDPGGDMPNCQSIYSLSQYLEGGPNIDYSTDLPVTADTLWTFLAASEASNFEGVSFNDQIIPIYKKEWWDRVEKVGDLKFDNSLRVLLQLLVSSYSLCH